MAKTEQKEDISKDTKSQSALFFLIEDTSISHDTLDKVKKAVKDHSGDKLYLVIKSVGGDAYTGVRIVRHLKTKFKNIIGVVPDYAYSAATLMLLGTNKILVSPEGYIGPIDKPTEHGNTGDSISALDITQSIPNIASLASSQALSFYNELRGGDSKYIDKISKKDALEISWKSAVDLISPLIEKIDPIILQKSYRDLKIGLYYGLDLLMDGMLPGSFYKALDVVSRLVNTYPSHGYAIFRDEMKTIGLDIENFENNEDCQKIEELYNKNVGKIVYIKDIYENSK